MQVKYNNDQDITLFLTTEEADVLNRGPTNNFSDLHNSSSKLDKNNKYYILLKGACKELETYFFLGFSKDLEGMFKDAMDMKGFGKIIIPTTQGSWNINLSDGGIEHFRRGWSYGIRYNGSNKLFIMKEI